MKPKRNNNGNILGKDDSIPVVGTEDIFGYNQNKLVPSGHSNVFGYTPEELDSFRKHEGEQKTLEQKAADKIPDAPYLAVSYNDIQFEPTAYRENGRIDKRLFYFNGSLDRIKNAGYERHARSQEVFSLIIDGLEGRLANTPLQNVYDDMFKSYEEFMSLAWERKGNMLIAYLDPRGLIWNANNLCFFKNKFQFAEKHEFDITGKVSLQWIDLKKFGGEFVEWHYTRKFSELPEIMQKAHIYLPPDGSIWPVGRLGWFVIYCGCSGGASRGVRKKIP